MASSDPELAKEKNEKAESVSEIEDYHPDLANNVQARIQNPLHGLSREKVLARVDRFVKEFDLGEDLELFRKGALLAQSPGKFEELAELDEEDKNWIRRETTHKWSQPFDMYKTVIICSIAAAVQGWDQTGSNGANLAFPTTFHISDAPGNGVSAAEAAHNSWIIGVVNAAPYLACALFSVWLTDPLNHFLGRRGTIFFCGIFCTIAVIGSAFSQTWQQLFVTRLLLGVGMGPKATTVPVFAAENTPASVRGGLVMSWQLWTAFGILVGSSANLIFYNVGSIGWRLELGSAFLPAVPLVIGIYWCPESPRWYMKKGQYKKAFASFRRLRNSPLQAARDMFYVHCQLQAEFEAIKGSNYFTRLAELFTVPRVRRATVASGVVMLAQQMCGINIIAFYSSSIFAVAGYSTRDALLASWGFGAVNFLFCFPAIWTIDTFGRRNLLLFTFPNMAWTLLASGLCFLIPTGNPARVPLIALFIFIFAAFYSPGEGPVPFAYSAEVFPLTHRELGMSWAVAVCLGFAAVLGITFPRLLGALGPIGAFGFYAGLNVVAFVMIFLLLPETKQRTLEELDYVFAVPIRTHASYQVGTFLPYWIKRYVLFNKNATLKPLYNFDEVESITVFEKGAAH